MEKEAVMVPLQCMFPTTPQNPQSCEIWFHAWPGDRGSLKLDDWLKCTDIYPVLKFSKCRLNLSYRSILYNLFLSLLCAEDKPPMIEYWEAHKTQNQTFKVHGIFPATEYK